MYAGCYNIYIISLYLLKIDFVVLGHAHVSELFYMIENVKFGNFSYQWRRWNGLWRITLGRITSLLCTCQIMWSI